MTLSRVDFPHPENPFMRWMPGVKSCEKSSSIHGLLLP